MKEVKISLAGLGTVGSHVIKSIIDNENLTKNKGNIFFNIVGISARNKSKKRIFKVNDFNWYDNPENLLTIPDLNIFIELIGEEKGLSYNLVKKALQKKINVVTANKALLSRHGKELFKLAEENNVSILFEAAVAGGIPIIKILKNSIFLNKIKKISGILNGTTNFVLSEMENKNISFEKALKIAQISGFAESDPTNDIEGIDSAHKLSLLSSICFGSNINFENVFFRGIQDIHIDDIKYAKKLGYKIKLISISEIIDNNIYSIVEPTLIKLESKLAKVNNVLNAIKIETNHLDSLFLEGEGAGGKATASSIISDLYEISISENCRSLGYLTSQLIDYRTINHNTRNSSYYLRIQVKDVQGVLAKITSFLNEEGISIETILQIPEKSLNNDKGEVPIIITTHGTNYNLLKESLIKIENLDLVISKVAVINIDKTIN